MPKANKATSLACGLIGLYQKFISPMFGPKCRFYPSCSHYAKDALIHHGFARGGYLAARRCLKCHPFHPGGIDPVPETKTPMPQHNLGETS